MGGDTRRGSSCTARIASPGASTAAARPSVGVIVAAATAAAAVPLILFLRSDHWCIDVAPGWRYRGVAMPVDPLIADHFPPRGPLCDPGSLFLGRSGDARLGGAA
jgi:hypothetical protein